MSNSNAMVGENDLLVVRSYIALSLGVSDRTITNYIEKGMPFIKKSKISYFKVRECFIWAIQNGFLELPIMFDEDDEDIPANVRKDLADAKIKEFKLKELNDEVVKKTEVIADATQCAVFTRERMLSIPDRVASELASEDNPKEIIKTLKREISNGLMDVSSEFLDRDVL